MLHRKARYRGKGVSSAVPYYRGDGGGGFSSGHYHGGFVGGGDGGGGGGGGGGEAMAGVEGVDVKVVLEIFGKCWERGTHGQG
jgi:hypothetical protein